MYELIKSHFDAIQEYIENNLGIEFSEIKFAKRPIDYALKHVRINKEIALPDDLDNYFEKHDKKTPFTKMLFNLIDQKGLDDVEVYQRAMIDRRHFAKIRSKFDYQPSKETVFSFILALELNVDQATDLLQSAGFAFNMSNKTDLIILYCLENEIYDLNSVNFALQHFEQPLLRVLLLL